jgi:hypothetical protein
VRFIPFSTMDLSSCLAYDEHKTRQEQTHKCPIGFQTRQILRKLLEIIRIFGPKNREETLELKN